MSGSEPIWIVKIGSSLITQHGRGINGELIDHWASGFRKAEGSWEFTSFLCRLGPLPKA